MGFGSAEISVSSDSRYLISERLLWNFLDSNSKSGFGEFLKFQTAFRYKIPHCISKLSEPDSV
jgi:uncharacterized protein YjfI (DUF2170 family)